jgi:pimeloyl-ACP methyl ester carboxylesterase
MGQAQTANQMPYDVQGVDDGRPAIVLVPGGLSGWVSWKPHAEVLSKRHRVIRVQLLNMVAAERGEKPPVGYSLRSESEALGGVIDLVGHGKVHLVGWSHGGEVSLDFALNHPEKVKSLTLVEPACYWVARSKGQFGDEEKTFRALLNGLHDPVSEDDLVAFLKLNGLVPPGVDPRSMPRWAVWNNLKIALKSVLTVLDHTDDIGRLERLRVIPVLLVKGRESVGFNSGVVDILSSELDRSAKVLVLPDSHACHIVAMDQFIAGLEAHIMYP